MIRNCRSCGATIMWIETAAGKKMPCEPGPCYYQATGTGETFINRKGIVERGIRCKATESGAHVGWKTHWADCPGAKTHRRHHRK